MAKYYILSYHMILLPCFSCRCRRDCAQTMPMPCHVILRGCTRARGSLFSLSSCFDASISSPSSNGRGFCFLRQSPKTGRFLLDILILVHGSHQPLRTLTRFLHDHLGLTYLALDFRGKAAGAEGIRTVVEKALRDMMVCPESIVYDFY